jgi:uncharacterized SAM-binding protein YcdF (DUF218 family)
MAKQDQWELPLQKGQSKGRNEQGANPVDSRPIEPESGTRRKIGLIRWIFFLILLSYTAIAYFHAPILSKIGAFLVVSIPPQESDAIVCLSGSPIDRGLATADAFHRGLAPFIVTVPEERPEGLYLLKKRGIPYPESVDLLFTILKGMAVPESALIKGDTPTSNTADEAKAVRVIHKNRGFKSIILVTSPTHTRRTLYVFRKVFAGDEVVFYTIPSSYSQFKTEDWWKHRKYQKEVLLEYQKLLYYLFTRMK